MFLETLVDFVLVHREDLQDWLFVLLTQLLKKMGADLLGSVQAKVQKALDITRSLTSSNCPGHRGAQQTFFYTEKGLEIICPSIYLEQWFPTFL